MYCSGINWNSQEGIGSYFGRGLFSKYLEVIGSGANGISNIFKTSSRRPKKNTNLTHRIKILFFFRSRNIGYLSQITTLCFKILYSPQRRTESSENSSINLNDVKTTSDLNFNTYFLEDAKIPFFVEVI